MTKETTKPKVNLWDNVRVGAPSTFKSPEHMWEKALGYFQWCEDNKLDETKLFSSQGRVLDGKVPHMRAMTQAGLCTFLNIGVSTWHDYKNKEQFSEVTKTIESIIYEQKFSGAAAGMLNANIIARDLGLTEKTETDVTSGGKALQHPGYTIVDK